MQPSTWASSAASPVDSPTGWNMDDEDPMEEMERRVLDEEPVLSIGSPNVPGLQHVD